ncbi:hypothetical protein, partial [Streptomyces flavofungini]|uniref:hypothetical protein n=1 Tax=Streptomyces flavofungini TaxID=68200 RepID=UPI0034E03D14
MADEQEKWLDRDAAERLLRGEPLEDVDPHVRAQADRLAQALGALSAGATASGNHEADGGDRDAALGHHEADRAAAPGTRPVTAPEGELPGEAAALAAFRAARADSAKAGARAPYATSAHAAAAARTVRLGRAADRPGPSRWGRPVRFGLAAALAGCMIGGVAVAAGTGVLPSPFGKHHEPGPAASASPVATPRTPGPSPSTGAEESSGALSPDDSASPDDEETTDAPETARPPEAEAGGAHSEQPTRRPGGAVKPPRADGTKDWYRKVVIACRDYRSGELQGEKRRRLEEFAKGPARVEEFCGRILGGGQHQGGQQGGGQHNGGHQGGGQHNGGDDGGDEAPGSGGDDGGDGGSGGGSGGDAGGLPGPPSSGVPATPAASYSAL